MAHQQQQNSPCTQIDEYDRIYSAPRRPNNQYFEDASCPQYQHPRYHNLSQPTVDPHYSSQYHQNPYAPPSHNADYNFGSHIPEFDSIARSRHQAPSKASSSASNDVPLDRREHNCDICGKYFERPHDVKRHRRSHFPGTYYCLNAGCPRTEKPFKRNDECKTHMRQHCKFVGNAPPIMFEQRRPESYYPGFM